ncbi:hypothetical protein GALL_501240 [mine drainage metagenome]|uniref:DUF3035 domain-containing protein n=1 Tax=mine drainage metagenome TaxID=410659 RepID=A0A1J5PXE0_9ZZZZ
MRAARGSIGIAFVAVLAVAGCGSDKTPKLMNLQTNAHSPDEFSILPTKPLQMPKDMAALPSPAPDGSNLADPTPVADAVTALGGKASALQLQGGIPAADGALVAATDRFGVTAGIRAQLAAEDLRWRKRHPGKVLPRLFGANLYYDAYTPMTLDAYAELARWRAVGAATPSAPPKPVKK